MLACLPLGTQAQQFEDFYPYPETPCSGTITSQQTFNSILPPALTLVNRDSGQLSGGISLTKGWQVQSENLTGGGLNYYLAAPSWYLNEVRADNMVIWSDSVPANPCFSFEAWSLDADYPEQIEVWVSTVSGNPDTVLAGSLLLEESVPSWKKMYSVDLSAWAGQRVWVAIRHHSNNQYILGLDNIRMTALGYEGLYIHQAGLNTKPTLGDTMSLKVWITNSGRVPQSNIRLDWYRMVSGLPTDFGTVYPEVSPIGLNESVLITIPDIWIPDAVGTIGSFRIVLNSDSASADTTSLVEPVDFSLSDWDDRTSVNLSVFPNPASDAWFVQCQTQWVMVDFAGKLVARGEGREEGIQIPAGHLPSGIYLLRAGNRTAKLIRK